MKRFETIKDCKYGSLNPKVDLLPDYFSGFSAEKRQEIVTKEAKFYRDLTLPYSVDEQISAKYVHFQTNDKTTVAIKVYSPKNKTERLPVVFFFHGGGFITCSVETHNYVPGFLAHTAQTVVCSVEYRLAPENKFPIGLEDCYEAIMNIIARADEFNIDASKVHVCGDSSGGNFAAVISLMSKQRKEFRVSRQILIYPVTDLSGTVYKKSAEVYKPVGGDKDKGSGVDYIAAYIKPSEDLTHPWLSPLLAEDVSDLPEALFIQAECDALLDDGLMYAKKLQDAGVSVACCIYEGMPHAFILRTYSETFDALNKICDFIKKC